MADENLPDWARDDPKGDNLPDWARDNGGGTATASQSLTPETDRAIGQQFSIDRTPRRPPAPTGMMSWFRRNRVSRPSAPVTDPGTPAPVTVPPPGMSSPSPTPTVDASTGLAPSALPSPPGTTPSGSWFDQGKDVPLQRTPFTPPPGVTPYPLPPGASEPSPGFDGPPDRSTGAAVAGGFARNLAPMAAFGAGFELASGPGAAVGGAIGTAIVPGLGTAIGSGLGWLIGGSVAGGLAYAGTKWGQDKLAKKISPHGIFSPEVEEMQEKEHPLASMIGAASAGGKPNPKNLVDAGVFLTKGYGRAALVEFAKNGGENLTEEGLKQVHNVMNVAQAGGLGVAFKVKDQIEAGKFDPKDFATGVGIQLLFNDQWHFPHNATDAKVGQKLIDDVNKGFRKQEQQAGIIPPPPVEPGATIMDPVEAKRRGLERLQSESARVQPPKEGGDPDATQVESTAPVPGGDKGPQVGKGTSLFPLDKGPAGARSGEEPVSPGQTVAAKAPPADEVAIAQGVLKPDAPFRTRINLRAGSNEPLYVRLVDGSEHRIGPITPIRQDGEIVLDDGNTVDPRVVKEFLDENRNPIVDQLKETGKKAAEIVAEDETKRKPEAPLPGHGKAIKDMTDEELASKIEALGPKHPITPVLKAELSSRKSEIEAPTVDLPDYVSSKGGFKTMPAVYLRFGKLPEGKSGQYLEGKRVGEEPGVSVVKAWKDPKTGKYVIRSTGTEDVEGIEGLANRKIYEVSGKEMADLGSDEEPLLEESSGKVLKEVHPSQVTTDALHNIALDGTEWAPHETPSWLRDEEAAAQREYEKDQLEETQEQMRRGGDELVDVLKRHGLPAIADSNKQYYGEINYLRAMFKGGATGGTNRYGGLVTGTGEKLLYRDVFKKGGGTLDSLVSTLKRAGFENPDGSPIDSISDALELIQNRFHTGKLVYGNESKAQELESQSFQDYQPPMKTELEKPGTESQAQKARLPWSAKESNKPGREKSPDQLDKDIAIQAKAEEGLPLPKAEPGTDIVATSMDEEQMERLAGKDMYKKSFTNTVINELLQNGFDAVREAGASEGKPGKISIDYDYNTRTIKVTDNGVGMSPETIVSSFLRTGGTKKSGDPQNTSGGLGLAKLTFVKGSSRIRLETVKDGLKSVMDVTAAQIKAKQIPLVKTRTNEPNGTTVTVEVPKSYVDLNGETQSIHFDTDPDVLKNPLFGPVEVTVNGKIHPMGIHTTGWEKDNTFNFRWGHADVYVDPKPLGKYSWGDTMDPKYRVMSAGLYQFDISPYNIFKNENEFIPHNMVIDVRPHVDTKDPQYPFDNQREGWRGSVTADMKSMYAFLKKQGIEQRLKKDQETFSKVEVMPHVEMGDLGKNLSQDQVAMGDAREGARGITTLPKVVSVDVKPSGVTTNYDTGKKDVQSHEQFQKSTFSSDRIIDFDKSKLDTTHLRPEDPLFHNNTNIDFNQIKGAPELHSKVGNLLVHFMRAFGQRFGTDPTARHEYGQLANTVPGHSWLGGISYDTEYAGLNTINPFKAIWINPAGLSEGAMKSGPKRAAVEQMHTFLHEITHVPERNEGGGFTREEMNNVGRMVDFPPHEKFVKALVDVYTKHWDTLNEIRRRFHDPDTKNRSESFKAGSALGRESGGGKGADKGLPGEHAPEDERVHEQGPTGPGRAEKADSPSGSLGDIIAGQAAAARGTSPGKEPPATGPAARPAPAAPRNPYLKERPPAPAAPAAPAAAPAAPPTKPKPQNPYLKPAPVEPVESHPAREPTRSEKSSPPGQTLTDDQMGQITRSTFNRLTAPKFEGAQPEQIAYMPRNRVIDSGREVIRSGVDPEELVRSRQVPNDQKYAVARAHSEDLREAAHQAEQLARSKPSRENKEAAEMAFADYANWNKQELEPLKTLVNTEFPEMEQEPFDPRHYTDLRHEFVKKNNGKDPSSTQKEMLNRHAEKIQKTIAERNKLLDGYDAELEKRAPELRKDIKDGKGLYDYVADVINKIAPCN